MRFLGVTWVGVTAENGRKLVLSLALLAVISLGGALIRGALRLAFAGPGARVSQWRFWSRQAVRLFGTALIILGLLSIWFNDPGRLATAFGLVSAGLAFALQRVITSFAGYFVILRSHIFTVGDRIAMGGVRGDVMALGFVQTTIMEMGQPPGLSSGDAAAWVKSRQFTGRIVTVSNAKIFDDPVYNYTRDFPYIWEEIMVPITYKADRGRAEAILLAAARAHALDAARVAQEERNDLKLKFGVEPIDLEPAVFLRLTDNWIELTVRFVVETHRIRGAKSDMSKQIIDELDAAGIGVASSTYDIVGFPPVQMQPVETVSNA